jgi:hypothetical protein
VIGGPSIGFRSYFNISPGSTNPVLVAHERAALINQYSSTGRTFFAHR